MMIKLKNSQGEEFEVDINGDDTVERIKERAEEQTGIPPEEQHLIFNNQRLSDDDQTCRDLNITAGSVVHIVQRP
uniref:Ubiquitin-like domain-containing protein n=1 Tax=Panagrellus redivivus TaxID=6233 RepID=A0A7E4V4H5_PANRE